MYCTNVNPIYSGHTLIALQALSLANLQVCQRKQIFQMQVT